MTESVNNEFAPPLLFDGGYGTYLGRFAPDLPYPELANLSQPQLVEDIHQSYLAAGARALKTNTFGVNSTLIPKPEDLAQMVRAGWQAGCRAIAQSGREAALFADIGPVRSAAAEADYLHLARLFLDCGAENFLFETMFEAKSLGPALALIREARPAARIIVSFAAAQDGYTESGEYYADLLDQAQAQGADYVGLNCLCGPTHMLELVRALPEGKYHLSVMPNAGYPESVNGRRVYVDNPEYFGQQMLEIAALGVEIMGGCCGTTPEHIRALAQRQGQIRRRVRTGQAPRPLLKARPANRPAGLMLTAEVNPPADCDISEVLTAARVVQAAGAEFLTLPDCPLGKSRANSFMIACLLQRQLGVRVIPHLACRDRNQTAIQGDLLAASIEGVRHLLAVTGDVPVQVERQERFNAGLNSQKLIRYVASLNQTLFQYDPFHIYAALNVNAVNFTAELHRAQAKQEAGAELFFTQPIFSSRGVENYYQAKRELEGRVLAGIMPLTGFRNAQFFNNEVPGVDIPARMLDALRDKSGGQAREICLEYARELVDQLRQDCDGYYIVTPVKRPHLAGAVISYILEEHK